MGPAVQTGSETPATESFDGETLAPPHAPAELAHLHPVHHHTLLQAFQALIYIMIVALFLITFSVQPFRIPSASMEPTLLIGDFLLVDKQVGIEVPPHIYAPVSEIHHGDLVVFHFPIDPNLHLVKRVVGLPGDRLRLHEGRVFLNGVPTAEPYATFCPTGPDAYRDEFPHLTRADPGVDSRWWIQMHTLVANGELTIPPDSYFVLGDNRNNSEDSRYWGFVPRDAIVGKPFLIYFSLNTGTLPGGELPAAPIAEAGPAIRSTSANSLFNFARWDRIFRIIH